MKIIDKNKDFYDYYQNIYVDNAFTFDRRDSYTLTKKEFASYFHPARYSDNKEYFVTLQINHNFWLFKLIVTKATSYGQCLDYNLELLGDWIDYKSSSVLIQLSEIKFKWYLKSNDDIEKFITAISTNDIADKRIFDKFYITKDGNNREMRTIPILKNIGIASLVDAFDIYSALESYFSEQKTKAERTEAVGTANNDKITSHGFDLKKSFRGKN